MSVPNLVEQFVAAIIMWNTCYLGQAFTSLGAGVPQELWTGDAEPERDGLRPRRRLQSLLAA